MKRRKSRKRKSEDEGEKSEDEAEAEASMVPINTHINDEESEEAVSPPYVLINNRVLVIVPLFCALSITISFFLPFSSSISIFHSSSSLSSSLLFSFLHLHSPLFSSSSSFQFGDFLFLEIILARSLPDLIYSCQSSPDIISLFPEDYLPFHLRSDRLVHRTPRPEHPHKQFVSLRLLFF